MAEIRCLGAGCQKLGGVYRTATIINSYSWVNKKKPDRSRV
nr:hypothetical protein [Providencia rettgeri]